MLEEQQSFAPRIGTKSTKKNDAEESSDTELAPPITAEEFQRWETPLSLDQLVTALSYHPRDIHDMSLKASCKPPKRAALKRKIKSSSLGQLDQLPPEILHLILLTADIRSVARVAQTSVLGKQLVESLPPYQELMKHARSTLGVLGATGLTAQHTLGALHDAFRTPDSCVCCCEKAPFLYLPTLERCCHECLARDTALQCMPIQLAITAFGLSKGQVNSLCTVHTIGDREYPLAHHEYRKGRLRLVNIRAAKLLGCSVHGSIAELNRLLPKKPPFIAVEGYSWKEKGAWTQWLTMSRAQHVPLEPPAQNPSLRAQNVLLEPLGPDPPRAPLKEEWMGTSDDLFRLNLEDDDRFDDGFSGMVSVAFPSLLSNGRPARLYWCRGCEWMLQHWGEETPGHDRWDGRRRTTLYSIFLLEKARRAYSKEDLVKHLMECSGAYLQIVSLAKPSTRRNERSKLGRNMIQEAIANGGY